MFNLKRLYIFLFSICILSLNSFTTMAQTTYTWNGNVGDWNDENQWTPAGNPGSNDIVIINSGTVNLNVSASVRELQFNGGRFTGDGSVIINRSMTWTGGVIDNGTGVFTIGSGSELLFSGPDVKALNRELINNGTVQWTDGIITLGGNGGTITNIGSFQVLTGNKIWDIDRYFINEGSLIINPGSNMVDWQVNLVNNGLIQINSGILGMGAPSEGVGDYQIESGALLQLFSHEHMYDNNQFGGGGTILLDGNAHMTVNGFGLSLPSSITLELASGTIDGNGPITIYGLFSWSGGQIYNTDTITVAQSGSIMIHSENHKLLSGVIVNLTTCVWSDSDILFSGSGGHIINEGIFDCQSDHRMWDYGSFVNNGTLVKSQGIDSTTIDIDLVNNGEIAVNIGTLNLPETSTGSGSFALADGTRLWYSSGVHNLDGNQMSGMGAIEINGPSLTININGTGIVIPNSMAVNFISGIIEGNGPLVINSQCTWLGGTINTTDTLTVTLGGKLIINPISAVYLNSVLVNQTTTVWSDGIFHSSHSRARFINERVFEIQADAQIYPAVINNGVINKTGGNGITTVENPITNNNQLNIWAGQITLDGGISGPGSVHINPGTTLQLAGGTSEWNDNILTGSGTLLMDGGSVRLDLSGNGLTIPPYMTFLFERGLIEGDGPIEINGIFLWKGGSILQGAGTVTVNPLSTFQMTGTNSKTVNRTLINNTSCLWSGGQVNIATGSGEFVNNGTLEVQTDSKIGKITNNGILRKSNSTGITEINGPFANNGLVRIHSGNLWLSTSPVNNSDGIISGVATLTASGSGMINRGTFSPGLSPGIMVYTGNLSMDSTSNLDIEIGGNTEGTEYDQLVINGAVTMNGHLNIVLTDNFVPAVNDSFTIMTYTSHSDSFSHIHLPSGIRGHLVYNSTETVLVVDNITGGSPNAVMDEAETMEDLAVTINVLANDYDVNGDPVLIESFMQPLHGTVVQSGDSSFIYTPEMNYSGRDSFQYTITDNTDGTSQGLVVILITPVNDPPEQFSLMEPADQTELNNISQPIMFRWGTSRDAENDPILYKFHLSGGSIDTSVMNISDTLINFDGSAVLVAGATYQWFVEATDGRDTVSSDTFTLSIATVLSTGDVIPELPKKFALKQNYPNPFNPTTQIEFLLPVQSPVYLSIYNIMGQRVAYLINGQILKAGSYSIPFDGSKLPSGIYIYHLQASGFVSGRKMILLK